jgi:hypothetical protein
MRPSVVNGDYALIKPCTPDQSQIGDIVAVNNGNSVCMHRLVWKNQTKIVMKGDSLSSLGIFIIGQDSNFIGKVISITRNNKLVATEKQCGNIVRLLISLCLIPWQIIRRH